MRRGSGLALSALAGLAAVVAVAGAAGLSARTIAPPGVSAVAWSGTGSSFGGWSGIDVSADGRHFWAVSDRARVTHGILFRQDGALHALRVGRIRTLDHKPDRRPGVSINDAEGVSLGADGSLHVSYEGYQRVRRHENWRAAPERLPEAPAFRSMHRNKGLEALAVDPQGRILTLPEYPNRNGVFPVWRFEHGEWRRPFALQQDGSWKAVGADFGPDGRFYLLERQFVGVGFRSQIRRFDLDGAEPVKRGRVLYRSPLGRHGNLEGMGIWQDGDGHMRAVMVSDDNFSAMQRTEVVEVILPH
ncbi:hypothetical protein CLV78_11082 [Aliiruegeria haliotis]|uniref:Phytase-like domain-containing protein n=1 Tax=Aliiruegeria haliotis TaxID=1280846 RepID=A0A2T0RJ81_9RHOB|nr:esterase-like activity of phytase family protein [Aliiruegeria haliotis]PRY21208.1 hypothetical protein CLV78_11082 [Aliiruegeria haliotis]